MNGRQPHEVAELDQGYAELRDMVADLISKAREHLTEGELPRPSPARPVPCSSWTSAANFCADSPQVHSSTPPPSHPEDPPDGAR